MKLVNAGTALLPLASCTAILPRQLDETYTDFSLIAIHSGSPIHLSSINASGNKFWIGKDTTTFCPVIDGLNCSQFKNITAFTQASDSDFLGLVSTNSSLQTGIRCPRKTNFSISQNTEVPGGQSVYVGPNGALSFTVAHSAFTPAGSSYESFNATVNASASGLGSLTYNGTEGFVACPTRGRRGHRRGPYQVFVDVNNSLTDKDVPLGCVDECIGLLAATVALDSASEGSDALPAAWQYE